MAKVVMVYGQPGAGKGTQASLLQAVKGFFHFDTGMYLEQVVHDPTSRKNKIIQRERKLFNSGILCTPSWVLDIVSKKAQKLARGGINIVFSGSPRTLFEAFGDPKNKGLIEILEKSYGKKNLHVFYIKVSLETSIWRNSHRLVCSTCGAPVLHQKALPSHKATARQGKKAEHCTFCASPLRKRTLDKPETIKLRLKQFEERTYPIFKGLKKQGHKVNVINGEPAPYKVFSSILSKMPS